jgi:hypothetical protein
MMNEIVVLECKFRVFESGDVHRETKLGAWKPIKNSANHSKGYNVIVINKKQYMRSRLVFLAFMNHESMPEKVVMHHKDGDRLNCALSNLSVETYSSISYYRTDTCGWQYDPKTDTYNASITKGGEMISLGRFNTADEAYEEYNKTRATLHAEHLNYMKQKV